ncbi:MAG TPA: N-acetylmannosamine-6-phosphate 2-epimerase [Candidatus Sumerlaeota bacterium]|nr:MAG: putative N-acetylmannosamine-6-phosphate 2-epimerase [candidate division BRC1 bacterium ADurb.Bin183]HOE63865.1 N-acetylmannosamine-6-phosphate 2-epimerase [Candidatus Sumerlaeota bacterium]HRR32119.1 N-acetylmannosamine-6-phosphate 2-epimerase [Candidatus Sumerlaeia bacterium]HON49969.1 N-acetylmannosamine-6-phosphate 2-epimerase [Candidatus Sumerlaeota bacterium]HOR63783.1 N-acetylmannosamine-6-phosphate 2-epimerase [Candidatus Sumerlaeota bacterium]
MIAFEKIFKRGLIVSCQAREDEPLFGGGFMAKMALAAQLGGAVGIRANGVKDVHEIKLTTSLPIIGINKIKFDNSEVYITPTFESAKAIAKAGADMIAIDGTARPRPNGEKLSWLIARIHDELQLPVMADCSTSEEGLAAAQAGADVVASTLSGYTPYSPKMEGPDLDLIKALVEQTALPVIAEGRYHYPEQAGRALQMGAHAVVVGGAITRPQEITKRFVAMMNEYLI